MCRNAASGGRRALFPGRHCTRFCARPPQTTTKRMKTVREVVKAAMGLAPYEKRILEVIKVGFTSPASLPRRPGRLCCAAFAADCSCHRKCQWRRPAAPSLDAALEDCLMHSTVSPGCIHWRGAGGVQWWLCRAAGVLVRRLAHRLASPATALTAPPVSHHGTHTIHTYTASPPFPFVCRPAAATSRSAPTRWPSSA